MEGTYNDRDLIFLARHGRMHSIPPHLINYRANIRRTETPGVTAILATTAVGSAESEYKPGDFVLPDQFIDFTKAATRPFHDGGTNGVVHVDMTSPTARPCAVTSFKPLPNSATAGFTIRGTYVCRQGPRF